VDFFPLVDDFRLSFFFSRRFSVPDIWAYLIVPFRNAIVKIYFPSIWSTIERNEFHDGWINRIKEKAIIEEN
jgi:hypothetical protein